MPCLHPLCLRLVSPPLPRGTLPQSCCLSATTAGTWQATPGLLQLLSSLWHPAPPLQAIRQSLLRKVSRTAGWPLWAHIASYVVILIAAFVWTFAMMQAILS